MFFVHLQIGMKKVFTSVAAVLLGLWYLLSVIGFDVHTCTSSGETFIATVASGFSCEDIHPSKHMHNSCSLGCACRHQEPEKSESDSSFGMKSCCSDDFQMIFLTGTPVSGNDNLLTVLTGHFVILADSIEAQRLAGLSCVSVFHKPRSWIGLLPDLQASYSVWRI